MDRRTFAYPWLALEKPLPGNCFPNLEIGPHFLCRSQRNALVRRALNPSEPEGMITHLQKQHASVIAECFEVMATTRLK